MNKAKKGGLEIVRAISACLVVYNHILVFNFPAPGPIFSLPGQYATEAVMIFFVLSGVVITLASERLQSRTQDRSELIFAYLGARLKRIYPIFLVGLGLALVAQHVVTGRLPGPTQTFGNLVFLQSLQGYIVAVPMFNTPLWSLACEMAYYLLFAVALVWRPWTALWGAAAIFAVAAFDAEGGGWGEHVIFVLALSVPWLSGHFMAAYRRTLPAVSLGFGVSCAALGIVLARANFTTASYDVVRLIVFSLSFCPLMLALCREGEPDAATGTLPEQPIRIAAAAVAIALLWATSRSLFVVMVALTGLAILAALVPVRIIEAGLGWLRPLRAGLVYLGAISYAIYAVHAPIIALVIHAFPELPSAARAAIIILATLGLSHGLEMGLQPLLRLRSHHPPARA
jgi:peptidoglycan/LPS O-acetylase OafA/YrhL